MPMKAMVYKTLSTVIDDMFAFIIKMPILHRLACFRDDVVFLVFLYQVRTFLSSPNIDAHVFGAIALDLPHRPEARERVWTGAEHGRRRA